MTLGCRSDTYYCSRGGLRCGLRAVASVASMIARCSPMTSSCRCGRVSASEPLDQRDHRCVDRAQGQIDVGINQVRDAGQVRRGRLQQGRSRLKRGTGRAAPFSSAPGRVRRCAAHRGAARRLPGIRQARLRTFPEPVDQRLPRLLPARRRVAGARRQRAARAGCRPRRHFFVHPHTGMAAAATTARPGHLGAEADADAAAADECCAVTAGLQDQVRVLPRTGRPRRCCSPTKRTGTAGQAHLQAAVGASRPRRRERRVARDRGDAGGG
jgi:hypothetical protein